MSDVKPALTTEQWEAEKVADPNNGDEVFIDRTGPVPYFGVRAHDTWRGERYTGALLLTPRRAAGIAALALHGQPYGFTWEDVEALRAVTAWAFPADPHQTVAVGDTELYRRARQLRDLADRIAALLPPQEELPHPDPDELRPFHDATGDYFLP